MPIEAFEAAWEFADKSGNNPFAQLADTDGRIRTAVQHNLAQARFDLVLAVDAINDDLRRMVEYVNTVTQSTTTVVLVEFVRFHDGDLEILIPQEYGRETAVQARPLERRREWSVEEYVQWCRDNDPESVQRVQAFVRDLEDAGFKVFGGKASTPSLNCMLQIPGLGRKFPIAMYTYETHRAAIEIRFSDFKTHGRPMLQAFAEMACALAPVRLTVEQLRLADYRKRPSINVVDFTEAELRELAFGIAEVASRQGSGT
jgi:hypothetical protein